jgi:hypothetical protein
LLLARSYGYGWSDRVKRSRWSGMAVLCDQTTLQWLLDATVLGSAGSREQVMRAAHPRLPAHLRSGQAEPERPDDFTMTLGA